MSLYRVLPLSVPKSVMLLASFLFLAACGGEDSTPNSSADSAATTQTDPGGHVDNSSDALSEEEIAAYQAKVAGKVKNRIRDIFVRDFGVTEDQADCLFQDRRVSEVMMGAEADEEIRAEIRECGVDPDQLK